MKTRTVLARHEAFARRLAAGKESASDIYRSLYPKSRAWKPKVVWQRASELTGKVLVRLREIQAMAALDTIMDIRRRKQILSDIASADPADYFTVDGAGQGVVICMDAKSPRRHAILRCKSRVERDGDKKAVVTELSLRDPIAAIAELNKMEGVYAPEKFEGDIMHSMIMKEPDPAPKRKIRALNDG